MTPIKKFTDLIAWQKAHNLTLWVYKITKKFPTDEKFGLTSQLRRATVSVGANIAEGFGRLSSKDKRHFYLMSRTSLAEVESHFYIARDSKYISEEDFGVFEKRLNLVLLPLIGLLKSAGDKG
ncbi:MAG: four helix bundle protein [bacterium]